MIKRLFIYIAIIFISYFVGNLVFTANETVDMGNVFAATYIYTVQAFFFILFCVIGLLMSIDIASMLAVTLKRGIDIAKLAVYVIKFALLVLRSGRTIEVIKLLYLAYRTNGEIKIGVKAE